MKHLVLSCFAALVSLTALATVPPDIPPGQMPPAYRPNVPIPPLYLPPPIPDPAGSMTLARLHDIHVSGVLYHALLQQAQQNSLQSTTITTSTEPQRGHHPLAQASLALRPGTIAAQATGGGTVNVTMDTTAQNIEPTIAAVNIAGTVHETTVTPRYVSTCPNGVTGPCTEIYSYSTTDYHTFRQLPLSSPLNQLTRKAAYDSLGDPLWAVNAQTGGVWPKRLYCSALLFDKYNTSSNPSAIGVWHSDDGGNSWSECALVAHADGNGIVMDKPAIAVDWSGTASLGYVYVAYIRSNTVTPSLSEVHVAVSTDGGASFSDVPVQQHTVGTPGIVVDSSGVVTVFWLDVTYNEIWSAQSTTHGASFTNAAAVTGANVVYNQTIAGFTAGNAQSIPIVRYNATAGRIALVYFGRPSGTSNFQIYYTYKPGCTSCTPSGWQTPIPITSSANDHFRPAVDANKATGNLIVTYYRSNGGSPVTYDEDFAYLDQNGTIQQNQVDMLLSPTSSDPQNQTVVPGFIGDYQDVWDDYFSGGVEQAVTAWIGIGVLNTNTPTTGNDCLTGISY